MRGGFALFGGNLNVVVVRTWGEIPYQRHTGVSHILGSHFRGEIPKGSMSTSHENSGKTYNLWKTVPDRKMEDIYLN